MLGSPASRKEALPVVTAKGGQVKGNVLTIVVGEELYQFTSVDDWRNNSSINFFQKGIGLRNMLFVDANGRVLATLWHFQEAVYPVRVFTVEPVKV